jgi:hypothetical protein
MQYFYINQKLKLLSKTEREGGEERERESVRGEREKEREREIECLYCSMSKAKFGFQVRKKGLLCALVPLF